MNKLFSSDTVKSVLEHWPEKVAAVRSNALHIKYNELKTQVNDCETAEEVEAIRWNED